MPVMLPVYYIHKGKVCAAVNGQTGKVAVRCEKTRKTLPWWIRPIALTVATFLAVFFAIWFFTRNVSVGVYGSGAFTLVMGLFLPKSLLRRGSIYGAATACFTRLIKRSPPIP